MKRLGKKWDGALRSKSVKFNTRHEKFDTFVIKFETPFEENVVAP